jgi:hypothetical protein
MLGNDSDFRLEIFVVRKIILPKFRYQQTLP